MARIGIVLGAGGPLGQAYHLGVLTALTELSGWDARDCEALVGTSAGSLIGAYLRRGLSAADLAANMVGEQPSAQGQELLNRAGTASQAGPPHCFRPWPMAPGLLLRALRRPVRLGVLGSALLPAGTTDIGFVVDRIRGLYLDADWPDEEFLVSAVRLRDGRRVTFGLDDSPQVDVATAVAASCALPGCLTPVVIGEDRYVDGGAHSPTNADLLVGRGLDLVVISSPQSVGRDVRYRLDLPLRIARRRYLAAEVASLRKAGTAVIVFQPGAADLAAMGLNPLNLERQARVIEQARQSAFDRLAGQGQASKAIRLLRPSRSLAATPAPTR
ncbi:MAG: patatin-like phospholipase family protein [Frankiaceae bacterium]